MDFKRTFIRSLVVLGLLSGTVPPAATGTPAIRSLDVDGGTVAGSESSFQLRAADPAAAVSGVVLSLEGTSFGSSACLAAGPGLVPLPAPFAEGSPVTLAVPHRFGLAGTRDGALRVDSGGCARPTGSVLQPFTATVTNPGAPPQPLVLGAPVPLPDGPVELPDLPAPPGLPLEELPVTLPAARTCRGTHSPIGRSRASKRRGRLAVRCLLNRARRRRGLPPLGGDGRLRKAAAAHTRAMVKRGFFSHFGTRPPGRTLAQRLHRSRYLPARRWIVGENLAYGTRRRSTPASVFRAWMGSTGHRANILRPSFRDIGIGVRPGTPIARRRGVTYTTDFGNRRR